MKNYQKGFTIIELIVVIAIIAVLSGIVVVNMSTITTKSKLARVKADVNNFQKAFILFYAKYGVYPGETGEVYEYLEFYPSGGIPCITDSNGEHCLTEFLNMNWTTYNATYYRTNAYYYLDLWDDNGDGKLDVGWLYLRYGTLGTGTIHVYAAVICDTYPEECGYFEASPNFR